MPCAASRHRHPRRQRTCVCCGSACWDWGSRGALNFVTTLPDVFADAIFSPVTPGVRRAMERADILLAAMLGTSDVHLDRLHSVST